MISAALPLIPHPDHPPSSIRSIEARVIGFDANWLRLRWRIDGAGQLVIPAFAGKGRADGLWTTTCFEAFLRPDGGDAYVELNLAPSERWAAYDFSAYREGMAERAFPREPECSMRKGEQLAIFDAAVPAGGLPQLPAALGLSAVIEEERGRISYWALAHPAGKPDFHHAACFATTLEPPPTA
ncbi:DOMON-like domain-containing protein [Altererythrobacter sp. CC-YST694]|uniref:DOMON-like domain-containing protein n=1 Tax=Altererythrobacter sp. CC-YST694 TaxID=2755038 RepID=UPI001D024ACB|nr:DOMON-like domain-containing protein [Altererythrobacter sp. CC-YST694]MCB5424463.1 DOMON-like domain-containing protein [Altererythrobacter sp. CC-YST694]